MNREQNKTCFVPSCKRPYHSKGYCSMHAHRMARHGSLNLPKKIYETDCAVDGCTRKAISYMYCSPHYHRYRRYGDPTYSPVTDYTGIDMSLYHVWQSMKNRCFNRKVKSYRNYGARGITVCLGWRGSYTAFITDLGIRPAPGLSIDRKDNDGNYSCGHCPECVAKGWRRNVQWATRREQSHNSRAVRWLTCNGKTKTIADWTLEKGLGKGTISDRLSRGWSVEHAINTPFPQR